MTHDKTTADKIADLTSNFLSLSEARQDSALIILRALVFAQSVTNDQPEAMLTHEKEAG